MPGKPSCAMIYLCSHREDSGSGFCFVLKLPLAMWKTSMDRPPKNFGYGFCKMICMSILPQIFCSMRETSFVTVVVIDQAIAVS